MSNRRIITRTPALGGIALVDPARNPFIEHPEITISFVVKLFVGQTGQFVWTRSVQDDYPITGDIPGSDIDAVDGDRQRIFNMPN
jgi:hypothetical protein